MNGYWASFEFDYVAHHRASMKNIYKNVAHRTLNSKTSFIGCLARFQDLAIPPRTGIRQRQGMQPKVTLQTSSTAVNPTSALDVPHEVSLPRSSVSTLVGDGKNPAVAPQSDIASKSA